MVTGGGCRPGHRRVRPLWVDLKLSLYCCGYAPATRDCVTSQLHSSHPRLRIPDMTRPLPIAASLVLAALSFAAFTQPETETAPPATSERSEERRVGKEGVSTCSIRWSTDH